MKVVHKYSSFKDYDHNVMKVVLDKIDCPVVMDTLEVLAMHLGRVAEADNRMDIDNLGLLFGQAGIQRFHLCVNLVMLGISLARPNSPGRHAVLCRCISKP